ncbi:hypothetical protein SSS_00248 [Sarcoptes scabiei]|nr:hypothetical protein SSS_00248 [Sarcoptes scabiei]
MDLSMIAAEYGRCTWIKVAALAGCTAVLMGAYGAHGLKNISNERRQVFETANKYHFYHALAMLAVPFLKRYHLVGALFSSGIMVFCGTCYCNAITGNESVIRYTPIGGWMFIIGCLMISVFGSELFLVETIPDELEYSRSIISSQPTFESWIHLLNSANHSIDIASYYWTLFGHDVMNNPPVESIKGKKIFDALINAKEFRSIQTRIVANEDAYYKSSNLDILKRFADIRLLNMTRLQGTGILHTKFIVVDRKDFYIGSANMDWRSLTHVKELGLIIRNNLELADDLMKIFEIYWFLAQDDSIIPSKWPKKFQNRINFTNPLQIESDYENFYTSYLTSSPPRLCPQERTQDIDAILTIIFQADHFIYIAVMDYFPLFKYQKFRSYWPVIDDALRRAAVEKHVEIRLLASQWNHTSPSMHLFLKSLSILNKPKILKGSISVKLFTFPQCPYQSQTIPYSEVNHNKYMVTDKTLYVGTSNWSADYFVFDCGSALILDLIESNRSKLHQEAVDVFIRDWNSEYALNIE